MYRYPFVGLVYSEPPAIFFLQAAWKNGAETARGSSERTHTNPLDEWVPVLVSAF